jgi:hypothetical protein
MCSPRTGAEGAPSPAEPVCLWVPDGFDPSVYLPPGLQRHADCARYILHRIHYEGIFDHRFRGAFVPLKAAYLRRFFPGDHVYTGVRKSLIANGAVVCNGRYVKGRVSYRYKLGPALAGMRHRRFAVTNRTLAKKLRARREAWVKAPEDDHRHLHEFLRSVEIDAPGAIAWLGLGNADPHDWSTVEMIRDGEFFFHVCDYGRVHTNLTNLKSELRGFLTYRGAPLVNLDIRNSQPLFLALLIRDRYPAGGMPADVQRYLELTQGGRLYEHMMQEGCIPAERRGEFKERFFAVFFGENRHESNATRLFASLFPNVYAAVRAAKEPDYTALSKALQRAESDLIILGVARRCMNEIRRAFIATIHDSILTTQDNQEAVLAIMREEFKRVGLRPTIRAELLQPPDGAKRPAA